MKHLLTNILMVFVLSTGIEAVCEASGIVPNKHVANHDAAAVRKGESHVSEVGFPAEVVKRLNVLTDKMKSDGINYAVREEKNQLVLEEHGFDILPRFIVKRYVDKSGSWPEAKTVTLELNGADKAFKIFDALDSVEEYTVDSSSTYEPFHLVVSASGNRLVSMDDISCMSHRCEDTPVDMDDGWGLFSSSDRGGIIGKTGDPSQNLMPVEGRPQRVGKEWVIPVYLRTLLLPTEKPVATLAQQEFRILKRPNGKRALASKRSQFISSPDYVGEPVDYGKSVLLDTGNGFQLILKRNFDVESLLMTEPPTAEEGRDYVTIQTEKDKHVVRLDYPRLPSPPFDKVVWKNEHLWVVTHKDGIFGRTYSIFSPNDPNHFWGPYKLKPKLAADTVAIRAPAPKEATIEGYFHFASEDDGILFENANGTKHHWSPEKSQ